MSRRLDEFQFHHFLTVVADWAELNDVIVRFERDEYDGWFAVVQQKDGIGDYTVILDAVQPRNKDRKADKESIEAFTDRVQALVVKTLYDASRKRGRRMMGRAKIDDRGAAALVAQAKRRVAAIDRKRAPPSSMAA